MKSLFPSKLVGIKVRDPNTGNYLVLIKIGIEKYYKNESTNELYKCLRNSNIGDYIGKLVDNKVVLEK